MTETVDEAPSACPKCPNCQSEYSYQVGDLKVCTECAHEWAAAGDVTEDAEGLVEAGDDAGTEAAAIDAASVIRELKDRARQLTSGVVKKG